MVKVNDNWRLVMKKKKDDVKIYIAVHKKCSLPNIEGYIPLQVGKEGKTDLGFIGDNTGDNISSKNPNYCELTGMYWMYKNVKCNIIGLVHYRRYFFKGMFQHKMSDIISCDEIKNILQEYDVIVPKKFLVREKSNYENYKKLEHIEDLETCRDVISELTPEYLDSFDLACKKRYFYPYNMCILKKQQFDSYAEWLFKILFEVEKRVDITNYSDYDKRIFGFLSERLFNVWLLKNNNLKVKEMYVYNIENSILKQVAIDLVKNVLIRNKN